MSPILASARCSLRWVGCISLLAALAALACGCVGKRDQYTIVMTAHGDSLERGIRIERLQDGQDSLRGALHPYLEPGIEEMLAAAYRVPVDTAITAPYVAHGHFADVPDDIGTKGHYRHLATPLGEGFFYAERIRGMDDPAGWVARRFARGDTLAAAVADWLRFELVTEPEWPRIEEALEPELRAIARKVASVALTAGDADSLLLGWLLTFAPEHPLFALLGVPGLADSAEATQFAPYFARARADLARRLGLRSAADEARVLGFLADGPTAMAAYRRWAERPREGRALDESAVDRIFSTLTDDPREQGAAAYVVVELRVPCEPFTTNGRWDDSTSCVRWSAECARLEHRDDSFPLACAAIWSVPDSVVQRRLFGGVVLDGSELFQYADWFTTLTPARQGEWNHMVLALRPGGRRALERFRFKGEQGATDASAYVRNTLLAALDRQAERAAAASARPGPPPRGK